MSAGPITAASSTLSPAGWRPTGWRWSIRSVARAAPAKPTPGPARSEEHTSELHSLMRISYAVFCLKKKKHKYDHKIRPKIIQEHRIRLYVTSQNKKNLTLTDQQSAT